MTHLRALAAVLPGSAALSCLACLGAVEAGAAPVDAGWPLSPRPEVVRGFEPPPGRWLPGHRGVDLLGAPGQPVRAAAPGRITYAGQLAGRGVVVITHGATRTTYEPVVASVRVGRWVTAGEQVGRLSAAGSHCAPRACLHWGLRRGDAYLDPLGLVRAAPVRLLPIHGDRRLVAPMVADQPAAGGVDPPEPSSDRTGGAPAPAGASAGDLPGGVAVALAAMGTVLGGILIRRH